LLAIVFFAAFHEFVRAMKQRWQEKRQRDIPDGEVPLTDVHAEEGTLHTECLLPHSKTFL